MKPVLQRLRDHFESLASELSSQHEAARVLSNATDAGTARESSLESFLRRCLPRRCNVVRGGFIFDASGTESRQVDLMVISDLALQFTHPNGAAQGKCFTAVEGTYAAISVKTRLDKESLFDSLDNIASIPPMPDMGRKVNPALQHAVTYSQLPLGMIFAFEGLSPQTMLEHVTEFYEGKPSIRLERKVDLIIVNQACVVVRTGREGGHLRNGTRLPPWAYHAVHGPYVGAWSLIYMLTRIQMVANYGPHVLHSFTEYLDGMPL